MPTETISSQAYLVAVTKSKIVQDVFKTFWSLLGKHVHPTTNKFWYPAYPFHDLESGELSYPIGIIESPTFSNEKFTIRKKFYNGRIRIEIYATSAEKADQYIQEAMNAIDSEEQTFWTLNLRMLTLESSDQEYVIRDEASIHIRRVTYTFRYSYTRGLYASS